VFAIGPEPDESFAFDISVNFAGYRFLPRSFRRERTCDR
jgi:hypothetical protein